MTQDKMKSKKWQKMVIFQYHFCAKKILPIRPSLRKKDPKNDKKWPILGQLHMTTHMCKMKIRRVFMINIFTHFKKWSKVGSEKIWPKWTKSDFLRPHFWALRVGYIAKKGQKSGPHKTKKTRFLPFWAVFPFLTKNAPLARKDETGQKPSFEQNFEQFPKRGSIGKNKNEKISKKWPFFETTPQNTTSQKIMHKCIFERAPQISQNWPFSTPFLTCFWPKNLEFF